MIEGKVVVMWVWLSGGMGVVIRWYGCGYDVECGYGDLG